MPRVTLHAMGLAVLLSACAQQAAEQAPTPSPDPVPASTMSVPSPAATSREVELERRVALLEVRLLEKDAQVRDLELKLDEARREVVRAMAKILGVATRAEAASGMAEAEIALQSLRSRAGRVATPELAQIEQMLRESGVEFNNQNYGGSIYLANQAKSVARAGQSRLAGAPRLELLPGEVPFAVPVPLRVTGRANVREGPGTGFRVLFSLEGGTGAVGHSYVTDWVRITDPDGRAGWIFQRLVTGRQTGSR